MSNGPNKFHGSNQRIEVHSMASASAYTETAEITNRKNYCVLLGLVGFAISGLHTTDAREPPPRRPGDQLRQG
jgi:hypothetical protein